MLWVAHILLLLAASPIEALSCLEKISEKAPPDWKAQLKSQHSRALPSSKVPWSSSDWPSNRKATWAGQTSELEPPPDTLCARPTPSGPDPWTLRLKVLPAPSSCWGQQRCASVATAVVSVCSTGSHGQVLCYRCGMELCGHVGMTSHGLGLTGGGCFKQARPQSVWGLGLCAAGAVVLADISAVNLRVVETHA
jgi:hypothetical protein